MSRNQLAMAKLARNSIGQKRCGPFVAPQIALPVGIAITSFLIDLKTPDDIADGFFYLLAVLSCVWVPYTTSALYTAFGLILPMLLGSLGSTSSSPPWTGITNRVLGVIVMWLVALVVWRNARLIRDRVSTLARLAQLHDGRGFDTDAPRPPDRLGLLGLHERLTAIGGSLTVSNVTPHGVRIDALIPIG
jgi:hypothetical protein